MSSPFVATYAIDSEVADISGQKSAVGHSNFVLCGPAGQLVFPGGTGLFGLGLRYTATISHPTGTYRDAGFAGVAFLTVPEGIVITESFGLSDFVTPPSVLPTTKEDCRQEALEEFAGFKNQGQCMKFVVHLP